MGQKAIAYLAKRLLFEGGRLNLHKSIPIQ